MANIFVIYCTTTKKFCWFLWKAQEIDIFNGLTVVWVRCSYLLWLVNSKLTKEWIIIKSNENKEKTINNVNFGLHESYHTFIPIKELFLLDLFRLKTKVVSCWLRTYKSALNCYKLGKSRRTKKTYRTNFDNKAVIHWLLKIVFVYFMGFS